MNGKLDAKDSTQIFGLWVEFEVTGFFVYLNIRVKKWHACLKIGPASLKLSDNSENTSIYNNKLLLSMNDSFSEHI